MTSNQCFHLNDDYYLILKDHSHSSKHMNESAEAPESLSMVFSGSATKILVTICNFHTRIGQLQKTQSTRFSHPHPTLSVGPFPPRRHRRGQVVLSPPLPSSFLRFLIPIALLPFLLQLLFLC